MSVSGSLLASPWTNLTLFPESVPHLLHWDLSYLWLLQLQPQMRPIDWNQRCEAWRRLLGYFLLGELRDEKSLIREPFVRYTKRFGIEDVTKLYFKDHLVGIVSPVVIVRPLPDAPPSLPELPPIPPERLPELQYVLHALLNELRELAALPNERPLQKDLLQIVETLVREVDEANPEQRQNARWGICHHSARFLRSFSFNPQQILDEADKREISISTGRLIRLYVPICDNCGRSLAREKEAEAEQVNSSVIELKCPAGHSNRVQLEKLFIWLREDEKDQSRVAVCWMDREDEFHTYVSEPAFPPQPQSYSQNEIVFKWNAAEMPAGDSQRIWLKLCFPSHEVKTASIFADSFYPRLLVPGELSAAFDGIPVQPGWSSAWIAHERMETSETAVWYRGVQIAGLPFRFSHLCVSTNLDLQREIAPAIYPKAMHADWHQYRVMALGQRGRECRVLVTGGRALLPHVVETQKWPDTVSFERGSRTDISGVTWKIANQATPPAAQTLLRPTVCLGIDFGTTNTVVYFQKKSPASLNSRDNAISVRDFSKMIHWLAGAPGSSTGWFLPEPPQAHQDEHLLPSALWRLETNGPYFIRWSAQFPTGSAASERNFKWDAGLTSLRAVREAYLKEMFFYALPAVLERLNARGATPRLDIGFAYPLAFDYRKRQDFEDMASSICGWLRATCGLESTPFIVNESLASVRAHGAFNSDELFLVADMGGHTLDVALLSYRIDPLEQTDPKYMHQIGSIEFGGELFLQSLASRRENDREREREAYWKLRDSISNGTAAAQFAQDGIEAVLLERFQPLALEFIRVMLASFRQGDSAAQATTRIEASGAPDLIEHEGGIRPIRVLLVGNGWRLRELVAGSRNPDSVFREYFENAVRAFSIEQVGLGDTSVNGISYSKHWVACGALYAAKDPPTLERKRSESFTRLPSGISFLIGADQVKWFELLGDGGRRWDDPEATKTDIRFERDSGPTVPASWGNSLRRAFPAGAERLPPDPKLLEALQRCFQNHHFQKGPLTIAIESHWTTLL